MSVMMVDSFDWYTTLTQKYDVANTGTSIQSGIFRTGTQALKALNANAYVQKNQANTQTAYLGFAFYVQSSGLNLTGLADICGFFDGSNCQVCLCMDNAGHLQFFRGLSNSPGSGGLPQTAITGASTAITFNAWHYIEVMVTINTGTAGVVELKVDGVVFLQAGGINTSKSGNAYFGAITLGNTAGGNVTALAFYYDDLYLINSSGSYNNTFLGDQKVTMVVPSANGTETDWAFTGGATAWQSVNTVPPNDSDNINDSNVGDIERFTFPAISIGAAANAVAVNMRSEKTDSGTRSIRAAVKSGPIVSDSGIDLPLSMSLGPYVGFFETDPNTGSPWTQVAINAAEFGVKLTA